MSVAMPTHRHRSSIKGFPSFFRDRRPINVAWAAQSGSFPLQPVAHSFCACGIPYESTRLDEPYLSIGLERIAQCLRSGGGNGSRTGQEFQPQADRGGAGAVGGHRPGRTHGRPSDRRQRHHHSIGFDDHHSNRRARISPSTGTPSISHRKKRSISFSPMRPRSRSTASSTPMAA